MATLVAVQAGTEGSTHQGWQHHTDEPGAASRITGLGAYLCFDVTASNNLVLDTIPGYLDAHAAALSEHHRGLSEPTPLVTRVPTCSEQEEPLVFSLPCASLRGTMNEQ